MFQITYQFIFFSLPFSFFLPPSITHLSFAIHLNGIKLVSNVKEKTLLQNH